MHSTRPEQGKVSASEIASPSAFYEAVRSAMKQGRRQLSFNEMLDLGRNVFSIIAPSVSFLFKENGRSMLGRRPPAVRCADEQNMFPIGRNSPLELHHRIGYSGGHCAHICRCWR
jgi:hypothetical protein